MKENELLLYKMLEKSQEAFLLAIEIYNKPTIKYRLEGFSFFICNAWELLLKSYLVKNMGISSIYYKDKPNRTIALTDCLRKIITNEKDPVRRNLEIIIDLRNTSTHYIIKEMEELYLPFLQANTLNYSQKIYDYFNIDISNKIDTAFLSLVTNTSSMNDTEILGIYGNEIFDKYTKLKNETIDILESQNNDKLAININLNLKVVKSQKDAKLTFSIAKDAKDAICIVDKLKDINTTYPYSQKNAREMIMKNLGRKNISINLHQTNFNLICTKFNLKNNEDYFYYHTLSKRYVCSQKLIDFVTSLTTENPNLIEDIKSENKK
jgi:hypothetical protein